MHYIVLLACIGAVICNDLEVGTTSGRILFDEKIEASPNIWKQKQNVTVNATEHEVISCIKVTDERPDKDGSARIVEGGEGQKNVTIELQSPAVFRGFYFHVVVYAVQDDGQHPISITKDTDVNQATTAKDSVKDIVSIVPSTEKSGAEGKPVIGNQERKNRDTQDVTDPIVQYVNEEKRTKPELTTEVNAPKTNIQPYELSKTIPPVVDISDKMTPEVSTSTIVPTETTVTDVSTNSGSTEHNHSETQTKENEYHTESPATAVTGSYNQHQFDSISKELGQKVVYGITH